MNQDELDVLREAGATARAQDLSVLDNPFLRPEAVPGSTLDSIEKWRDQFSAWQQGWLAEDLARLDSLQSA